MREPRVAVFHRQRKRRDVAYRYEAFYPAKPPFPLLHVDTTWKFREMILFRDEVARTLGLDLIVHINEEGLAQGVNPFSHGSQIHTDVMKTQALKQALEKYRFDAAFGGARRDEEKSRAKERIFSFRSAQHNWDPKTSAARTLAPVQRPKAQGRKLPGLPHVELDGTRRVAVHLTGEHSYCAVVSGQTASRR